MASVKRHHKSRLTKKIEQQRKTVFGRFPLLFTLLATFGLVATLYGFEGVIDEIPLFAENRFILLTVGVVVLSFTGTLYKKLGN